MSTCPLQAGMEEPLMSIDEGAREKLTGGRNALPQVCVAHPEILRSVPSDMRTSVYPLQTSDGAHVVGCLHQRGGEKAVAFIMHPRELLITHYMVPYLVAAGCACWTQGPRSVGNDLRLEHELALLDVAAGMTCLQKLGFGNVIMLGNSGGAGLFAVYNQQAVLSPANRVSRTPAGRASGLDKADLLVPSGFIFLAPHPGQGKLLQNVIDPSVIDENDPFSVDKSISAFSKANGFEAPPGATCYKSDFLARYRKAQRERVDRIDAMARTMIAERMAARSRVKDGDADAKWHASHGGIFQVWRTDADPRCFDLSLDPSDRRWGTVWGADRSR